MMILIMWLEIYTLKMMIVKSLVILLLVNTAAIAADHSFTGLPITPSGWTDFGALISDGDYDSSRVIFVSNTDGDDETGQIETISDVSVDANGMFQAVGSSGSDYYPYQTISAGYAQLRDGYADILLLDRGDTWTEQWNSGSVGEWQKDGASADARMIVSSYGSGDRPIIQTGDAVGLTLRTYSNLIFSGIRFYHNGYESEGTGYGARLSGKPSNVLFEDCVFERLTNTVQGEPSGSNFCTEIAFRRCIFNEGNQGSRIANVYAESVENLLFEENVFANPNTTEGAISGNRFLYMNPGDLGEAADDLTGLVLRGNIFYHSGRTGLSIRCGGRIEYNAIIQNDVGLFGGHGGSGGSIQSAYVNHNVILESNPGDGYYAIQFININGGEIKDNIITDPTGLGSGSRGILVSGQEANYIAQNLDISGNIIYDWSSATDEGVGLEFTSSLTGTISGVTVSINDFQFPNGSNSVSENNIGSWDGITYTGNRYYTTRSASAWFQPSGSYGDWITASGETGASNSQVSYTDPGRTIGEYHDSIGGTATTAAFMTAALAQERSNWDSDLMATAVINYIRAGFDKEAVSYSYGTALNRKSFSASGNCLGVIVGGVEKCLEFGN
jgi:hypothetical protein